MDNQRIEFTPEVIAKQRAICDAATPGRWVAVEKGNSVPFVAIVRCATGEEPITIASSISPKRRDYEFIVAAHDNYPAALDALEASMAREAEKDAKIEEQAKRIQFLEDHILRITPEYKKSRDKLLDECDRLTAERDAEKRRADAAVDDIAKVC
ncbi:MAG TPA: hypothetical protein PKL77_11650, partial [Candidatus Omnitrophota bacterium]|nr:hypothetical protein [Candidatus Omnitrophota bacterium]